MPHYRLVLPVLEPPENITRWRLGIIENHKARPCSQEELAAAAEILNARKPRFPDQ